MSKDPQNPKYLKNPYFKKLDSIKVEDNNQQPQKASADAQKLKFSQDTKVKLLTKKMNADEFISRLHYEISRSKRYGQNTSLLMVGIDYFDNLCENWGEETASFILDSTYKILASNLREVDLSAVYRNTILCFILPETNIAGTSIVAKRMMKQINRTQIDYKLHSFSVSISCAIVNYPQNAITANEMITKAFEILQRHYYNSGSNDLFICD